MHVLLHSVSPILQQAITNPCLQQRLLDTHRQVWVSLLWGHCSFLLDPGAHNNVLFVPSKSLFLQSCVSSGGVNGDLLQEGLCHNQVYCKKAKWLSEEALQIAMKRREAKGKGEKETYIHLNAEFQRIARRDKKEIEENNRMGKTRDLFKKYPEISLRDITEHFMQR